MYIDIDMYMHIYINIYICVRQSICMLSHIDVLLLVPDGAYHGFETMAWSTWSSYSFPDFFKACSFSQSKIHHWGIDSGNNY